MIYFDTNIIVYSVVNQSENKMLKAQNLIKDAINNDEFVISPLVLQELLFILSKLKVDEEYIKEVIGEFQKYVFWEIDESFYKKAFKLSVENNLGKNINDVIHLVIADNIATKLITFDKDFFKLKVYADIEIEKL